MLGEIKEELLKNPEAIVEILEYFDFAHIKLSSREIRFARDDIGGRNISIRLERNECLYVNDYSRGVNADFFQYIIQEKNVTFREVLQKAKQVLDLSDDWRPHEKKALFGGIYSNILRPNKDIVLRTYDESVLDRYEKCGNLRFLRDGISLEAQRFWDIRFSVEDNAIIIPVYNEFGELIGTKARINDTPKEGESKYFYPLPALTSQTLYGYAANYQYLYGADTVYVGEAEKFCQQLYTIGIRNCVALGNHSISEKQSKLLLQLSPKSLTLMFDEGLDMEIIKRNADVIRNMASMMDIKIYFFDYRDCLELGAKDSPSDHGIKVWNKIIENNIKDIAELDKELGNINELDEIQEV